MTRDENMNNKTKFGLKSNPLTEIYIRRLQSVCPKAASRFFSLVLSLDVDPKGIRQLHLATLKPEIKVDPYLLDRLARVCRFAELVTVTEVAGMN